MAILAAAGWRSLGIVVGIAPELFHAELWNCWRFESNVAATNSLLYHFLKAYRASLETLNNVLIWFYCLGSKTKYMANGPVIFKSHINAWFLGALLIVWWYPINRGSYFPKAKLIMYPQKRLFRILEMLANIKLVYSYVNYMPAFPNIPIKHHSEWLLCGLAQTLKLPAEKLSWLPPCCPSAGRQMPVFSFFDMSLISRLVSWWLQVPDALVQQYWPCC